MAETIPSRLELWLLLCIHILVFFVFSMDHGVGFRVFVVRAIVEHFNELIINKIYLSYLNITYHR